MPMEHGQSEGASGHGTEHVYTRQAQKDLRKIIESGLKDGTKALISILQVNPFQNPPLYEKLIDDLSGACSRRITIQHRLVYQVFMKKKL